MSAYDSSILFDAQEFTAALNSSEKNLPEHSEHAWIEVLTTAYTSGTGSIQLQHSFDGTNWYNVGGAVTVTGTGVKLLQILNAGNQSVKHLLRKVRARQTATATFTATVKIHFYTPRGT